MKTYIIYAVSTLIVLDFAILFFAWLGSRRRDQEEAARRARERIIGGNGLRNLQTLHFWDRKDS